MLCEAMPPKIVLLKKWIVGMVLLWCMALLGVVGASLFWLKVENDGLRAVMKTIKENGLPVSARDLFPQVPQGDRNAAPLLKRAAGLVKKMAKDSPALRCTPGTPGASHKNDTTRLPEKELASIRSFLAEPDAREVLQLLSEAATKQECYFDRDYAKGIALDVSDATSMFSALRLLLNHSWCLAKDGDAAGAVSEMRSGMKICGFYYMNDPMLIPWLVGVSGEQMCLSAIMDVLAKTGATAGENDDLEISVKNHRDMARPSLVLALDGERIFGGASIFEPLLSRKIGLSGYLSALGDVVLSGKVNRGTKAVWWIYQYPLHPLLIADYTAYLRFMLGIRKVIRDPQAGEREAGKLLAEIPRTALLTRLTAPGLDNIARKLHEVEVSLDLALLGLRAEKFRAANGHYPKGLAEVPGPLPTDPFTGGEFIYKEWDANILIYSVGPDLIDNQGNPKKENGQRDIVWSVRRSDVPAGSP